MMNGIEKIKGKIGGIKERSNDKVPAFVPQNGALRRQAKFK